MNRFILISVSTVLVLNSHRFPTIAQEGLLPEILSSATFVPSWDIGASERRQDVQSAPVDGDGARPQTSPTGFYSGDLNLGTVTVLSGSRPVVGGNLIVNNFDYAYIAALREEGLEIIWDNIEFSFPSGVTQIIPNSKGFIAATGSIPINIK